MEQDRNWFNDYQKVEDFLINELGEKYKEIDFSKCTKASDSTIIMIKELIKKKASKIN
jgi:hypothetical protein